MYLYLHAYLLARTQTYICIEEKNIVTICIFIYSVIQIFILAHLMSTSLETKINRP